MLDPQAFVARLLDNVAKSVVSMYARYPLIIELHGASRTWPAADQVALANALAGYSMGVMGHLDAATMLQTTLVGVEAADQMRRVQAALPSRVVQHQYVLHTREASQPFSAPLRNLTDRPEYWSDFCPYPIKPGDYVSLSPTDTELGCARPSKPTPNSRSNHGA